MQIIRLISLLCLAWMLPTLSLAQNLSRGLIAHYRFNNDAQDASTYGNHGREMGGLQYAMDRYGNPCGAAEFNGRNAFVQVPHSSSLASPTNQLTVSVWFYLDPGSTKLKWLTIACKGNNPTEGPNSPMYRMQATSVTMSVNTEFTENLQSDFPFNTWSHHVLVYDGSSVTGYINGQKYWQFPYYGTFVGNTEPLEIGRDIPGSPEFYWGRMDDLRIYNRALSNREVNALYTDNGEMNAPRPCVKPPKQPPLVDITTPAADPHTASQATQEIVARIQHVKRSSLIAFEVNGRNLTQFDFDASTETFRATINLQPGNNIVRITGNNNDGSDSDQTTIIYQPPKAQPPVVTVTSPRQNPYTSPGQKTRIEAKIDFVPNVSGVTFRFNNQIYTNFSYNPNTGNFAADVNLNRGNNYFEIIGKNQDGEDQGFGTIIYQPQVQPPIITMQKPASSPETTKIPNQPIQARIQYVSAKEDIDFYFNGQPVTNFSYNPRTEQFYAAVTLQPGSNSYQITARNQDGQDFASGSIQLIEDVQPKQPPVVTVTSPRQNPYTSATEQTTIEADIQYVPTQNGVSFRLNGQLLTNFRYNPQNGKFSATVNLNRGNNVFEIIGKNKDGEDRGIGTILYQPKAQPPIITMQYPLSSPESTKVPQQTIRARIQYVGKKQDIDFYFNGVRITDFSFNPGTEQFSAPVTLQPGNNSFQITARNQDGQDFASGSLQLIQEVVPKQPPVVTITRPTANPHQVTDPGQIIQAQIDYVKTRSGVSFTLNGQPVNNFTFDPTSGKFEARVTVNTGYNYFEVTGTNQDGTDRASGAISYQPPAGEPPVVTIVNPASSPHETTESPQPIIATIEHVARKDDVTFVVNGKETRDFTYDPKSKRFTAMVELLPGYNVFEIEGENQYGTDREVGRISYTPPAPPSIPAVIPSEPTDPGQVTITETIRVPNNPITLVCFDHEREDGDIVSILVNDQVIADKLELKNIGNGEFRTTLPPLGSGAEYKIISKAWNLGLVEPNTLTIDIWDGTGNFERVILNSRIGESEAFIIRFK